MIIKQNVVATRTNAILRRKQDKSNKLMKQLALGEQITTAADDAAGLAISEKMRSQIRGLNQAVQNSVDGQSFLQTGEGALGEVEEELQRMREMAVRSANGTYTQEDRETMQSEFSQLGVDIDRIAKDTEFNTIPVFQYDDPIESDKISTGRTITSVSASKSDSKSMTIADVLANTQPGEFNLFYDEAIYDFDTIQSGADGSSPTVGGYDPAIINAIKNQIVPNVVENILAAYPAFGYLTDSSIGIGLKLYSDSSDVMAYVKAGVSTTYQTYQLAINMGKVRWPADREELERTISHEMIHAFMDEAMTQGMVMAGADKFPMWFIEGMAQTASGPGNWVKFGLGLTSSSSLTEIQSALLAQPLSSSASNTTAQYGTGYLATMYLGYIANGGGAITATGISNGLSKICAEVTAGNSLDAAMNKCTSGRYTTVAAFTSDFATDSQAQNFIHELLIATKTGSGGVINGDLTSNDLIGDTDKSTVKLFEVRTDADDVKNIYPSDVNVISGGSTTIGGGSKPVVDYDPSTIPPAGGSTSIIDDFKVTTTVTDGFKIVGDVLTVTKPGEYTIELKDGLSSTKYKIKLADGVKAKLNGVHINSDTPAIEIEDGAKAEIVLSGDNTFSSSSADGIHLGAAAEILISGNGKISAQGTNGIGGGAKVTIQSGTIIAKGTAQDIATAAIVIEGGSVAVDKTKLAGKQPTLADGTTDVYQHIFNGPLPNPILDDIKTVTAGGKTFPVSPDRTNGLALWLKGEDQEIIATDSSGISRKYKLTFEPIGKTFSVSSTLDDLFIVNGKPGAEAAAEVDAGCTFDAGTGILTITKAGKYKISGGTKGLNVGQIVIADGLIGVDVELDGVTIDRSAYATGNQAAMTIGKGSTAVVTLTESKKNVLKSGNLNAGLQVNANANLTITGKGELIALGGTIGGSGIGGASHQEGGNLIFNDGIIDARSRGIDGLSAGIGSGGNSTGMTNMKCTGDITINGGKITAVGTLHAAGIGGGGGDDNKDSMIRITGGTIKATGGDHCPGIGTGCISRIKGITISGGLVYAKGGDGGGAGIGAGRSFGELGDCGDITITGGVITADGGTQGAGIGSGMDSMTGNIVLSGGVITALGGPNQNNIGGYRDFVHNKVNSVTVQIGNTSIKAGEKKTSRDESEGLKVLGVDSIGTDASGHRVFVYPINRTSWIPAGSKIASIVSRSASGDEKIWESSDTPPLTRPQHATINYATMETAAMDNAYIWLWGEEQTVDVRYQAPDGTWVQQTFTMKFDAGKEVFIGEKFEPPKPINPLDPADPADPLDPLDPYIPNVEYSGLILQIGPNAHQIMILQRFWLSMRALDLTNVDIATQDHAEQAIGAVDRAIGRVSGMRGTYGSLHNRLDHVINGNSLTAENLTEAESRIRDTDMAKTMIQFQMAQVQTQAAQAMLAQANQLPEQVLKLLQ